MTIRVELYGLARRRAQAAECLLEAPAEGMRLGDALRGLALRFPELGAEFIDDESLSPVLAANLDGRRFVRDPDEVLRDGQSLLILSADGGG